MRLKEITPKKYQCVNIACPAVYELVGADKLVIVGSQVNPDDLGITHRVGRDEQAVMIDKSILKHIFEK